MVIETPSCHICGNEGESLLPWAQGGGEMRHCRECDFAFAWPLQHLDPVETYSRAYEGRETRTDMANYATRLGRRSIVAKSEAIGLWSPAHHATLKWLEENVPPGATVLEVGCGLGSFMRALRDRGYNAVGVDPARPVIDAIQAEGFQAWCGTVDTMPADWLERQPDAIVSFFILHHMPDPVGFFESIRTRWAAPLLIGYNRAPTKQTAEWFNFPPRTWGWWSAKAIGKALERAGYAVNEIGAQPKGVPQVFLPPKLHGWVSSILWRWPWIRRAVSPIANVVLRIAFKLLKPIPSLRKSFTGSLFIIATPEPQA